MHTLVTLAFVDNLFNQGSDGEKEQYNHNKKDRTSSWGRKCRKSKPNNRLNINITLQQSSYEH